MEKEVVYVFIDSQNLKLGIRNQGWDLDFKKFYIFLKNKYKANKIFVFVGYIKENENFYSYLKLVGYNLIFKPTLKHNNQIKGNVDAELVLYSIIEINNYTKYIIVSSDGDFYCLIKYLDEQNKFYKLIIANRRKYSSLLKIFRKHFVYLNEMKNKIGK